ncbi:cytochrome P450 4C1 [Trichonephila clavipes]|nr:cytochrome P450 4C1 [Trichonephila clavipes]
MLTPAFHFNILKDFLPVFNKQSKVLMGILEVSTQEEFVDIVPLITKCSLDIICESILGKEMHTQTQPSSPYVKAVVNLTEWVFERMQRPWLWNDFMFKISPFGRRFAKNVAIVHDFTNKVISEKKKELLKRKNPNMSVDSDDDVEGKKRKKLALMDLLLEEHFKNNSISEEGIREEVNTFTFEEDFGKRNMPYKRARRHFSQLSEFERGLIIGMKTAGWSTRRVAGQVDRSECAVKNCWEQWTREDTHVRKTGSGTTRKTTRRENRRIVRQALVDPTVTRSTIRADIGVAIVPQTISRHLAEANLKSKRPFHALPLTPEHRQLRLQWCQARSMWNVTDWLKVVFSDESRFVLGTDDNRVRVWRHSVERYNSPPPHCSTSHCPHSWCNGLGGHSL